MWINLLGGLLLGLAGSLHCIGMCGPLVLILPFNAQTKISGFFQSFIYHLGRVFVYVILGLLFGLVFQIVDLKYFEQYFSLGIGVLFLILWSKEKFFSHKAKTGGFYQFVLTLFGKAMRLKSAFGMFLAGMLNGLLPCGLVYGALLAAFGTGTTWGAMQFMLGFGLATIPAMLFVFFAKSLVSLKLRQRLSQLLPWWLLILGIMFLLRGANLGIPFISPKIHHAPGHSSSCCKPMQID